MSTVRSSKQKSKRLATKISHKSLLDTADGLKARRCLVAALEQQMWFFGCDAACADGNLLVHYGFRRHRLEDHPGQSSSYHFLWRSGGDLSLPATQVDLHGWCAGLHPLGDHGAEGGFLYVRARNRVGWYDAPTPPVPGAYDEEPAARRAFRTLGRCPESGFCRAAMRFLTWVEEYESWLECTCGSDYRRRCFERAPLPWLPPAEARGWFARYRQAISRHVSFPS